MKFFKDELKKIRAFVFDVDEYCHINPKISHRTEN